MTVRVGIVGVGVMGADHARKINGQISGAEVTVVADFDADRAKAVAAEMRDATVASDGFELISSDAVDAIVVASHDSTHAELVHAALAANKPVLCEKPLAPTAPECREIIAAQGDRNLISVGFMRRFDPAYNELKRASTPERIGETLVAHCISRNVVAGPGDSAATITNSAIHELDCMPWLLGSPITEVSWHAGRTSRHSGVRQDPQIMLLRTESNVLMTLELFVNARYGYDTRCEIVGEEGIAQFAIPAHVIVDSELKRSIEYPLDWVPRYAEAYRYELQEWVDAISEGRPSTLATAEDGLRAGVVADALVVSMNSGGRTVTVDY
ncbi:MULTISPECIES: Gfo/Idh/MocA family oxidoreductase [Rhodococcus]|uniref:Inositol 2-dehydrogenase n=1 Tax=Rhodococcoides kyotonense TaxID=398843 RepID=A0A177YB83_9NOCA|nr:MULTISPECIES: Gfo/Idh/MocA family oxidoreductase [Rhodococcus]NIL77794.1 Inositol 2-dehydrogenase [Rhodococcus sp. B10]OAK52630.1 inositol 2-dehydrogenase [Rhodococcus kyotonensis]